MGIVENLVKRLPWSKGRQGTGYNKICLFQSKLLMCDVYLLYYPQGSEIPWHTDEVKSGKHYRLNIMLKKATKGGEFLCEKPIYAKYRTFLFRPDLSEHAVARIDVGWRMMFSVGWVRK